VAQSTDTCSIEGCTSGVLARGWCSMHYARWKRQGEPGEPGAMRGARLNRSCLVAGCTRRYKAKGMCTMHYNRSVVHGDLGPAGLMRVRNVCSVDDCEKCVVGQGLCGTHRYRMRMHGNTGNPRPTENERFWKYVNKTDWCWNWTGTQNGRGYGFFAPEKSGNVQVHRYAYEKLRGPIPDGLTIDHLCRNTICVNPSHLEPVTQGENTRRGMIATGRGIAVTACPQGHQYTPENTYIEPKGSRSCRECRRERTREWRRKHRYLTT